MKNPSLILIIIFISLLHPGCVKDPPPPSPEVLPPITQTGANTFGCLMNGSVWIPTWHDNNSSPPVTTSIDNSNNFNLIATRLIKDNKQTTLAKSSISWHINNVKDTGTCFADPGNPWAAEWIDYMRCCYDYHPVCDHEKSWIHVSRLDLTQKIISGTFQLTFINNMKPFDTIKITEGRFDWRLK
jgi:hypothetical protein